MQFVDEVLVITTDAVGLDHSVSPAAPVCVFPSIVALADEACGDSTGAVPVFGVLPVVIASGAFVQTAEITVGFRSCLFSTEHTLFLLWC